MPFRLVPENLRLDFVKPRWVAFVASFVLLMATVILFFTTGLNYGTDFRGGILIEARAADAVDLAALRGKLGGLGLGQVELQEFGQPSDVLIRIKRQEGGEAGQNAAITGVRAAMGPSYEYRRVEVVGPRVGSELRQAAFLAVSCALLGIGLYVALRFEWQFGVAALVATLHDVVATVGLYSALRMEFDLTAVAALLTLAGYSMNDTVVVFDRIRETLRRSGKQATMRSVINDALNQTLSRTLMTSLTTISAVLPLVLWGGPALHNFALAITWGIGIGTFSSIYVAASMLLYMKPVRGIPSGLGKAAGAEPVA